MNDFHFGKKPSLKIFYNPHKCKLSIHCKKSVFNFSESEPYFEIDIFGKNHRINLTSARRIHTEDFNTAVDCGVRAVYDSFFVGTKKLPLTIDTTVRIDKETESVLFESKITGDTEGSILSYHWPQPIEFNDEDPDAYTAIPMMQGSLIPSKWHNTIIVNDGRYYSHDAYMPWFGQRWNNQGYLMTTITPEDAGYDIQHIPSESTRISNVWYPSLGRMSYERICELKLYGKCDYNDFCRSYRSYIKESGKFVSLKEKTERNPLLKKRIGVPLIQDYLLVIADPSSIRYSDTHPEWNRYFITFDERIRQLQTLSEAGLKKAQIHIDGWGNKGYDSAHPDVYPPNRDIGGAEGLKRFIEVCHNLNYSVDLHDQYHDFYRNAPSFNTFQTIQDFENNMPSERSCYGGDQNYLCPKFALQYIRRNYRILESNGIRPDGVHLASFAGSDIDECYNPAHKMSRTDCIAWRKASMCYLQSKGYITCSDEPIDCFIDKLDTVIHAPYLLTPIEWDGMCNGIPVPLFSLVYHDAIIVPWFGNIRQKGGWGIPKSDFAVSHAILNASPIGLEIDATKEEISVAVNCCNIAADLAFVPMLKHEFLSDNGRIQRTKFADGTNIEVNFDTNESRVKR